MKKSLRATISGFCILLSFGTAASAADLSGWAEPFYRSASSAGLVSYSIVSNNMHEGITRQEFCELSMNLYKRLTGEVINAPSNTPFTDTSNASVIQAYNYGIVNGISDTEFAPYRQVTRQEMAKMLVSTLTASEVSINIAEETDNLYLSEFTDNYDISAWARSPISTLLSYEIMTGLTDDMIAPLTTTTREQAIVSVNRAYSVFSPSIDVVQSVPLITTPSAGAYIEAPDFTVSWADATDAAYYHVLIKDAASKAIYINDVSEKSVTVTYNYLTPGSYSIIVGAVLNDGSEVFSLPVDFTYNYIEPDPTPAPTPAPTPTPAPATPAPAAPAAPAPAPAAPAAPASSGAGPKIQSILATADKFIGTPYLWGGTTPDGFDCSGFVQYVYQQNGYSITRTTYTQWDNDGTFVNWEEMKPGDLMYFGTEYGQPSHVGMYVGGGKMIHSPHTGDVVKYCTIESGYYKTNFMGAKRIIW